MWYTKTIFNSSLNFLVNIMKEPTYRQAIHASWKMAWNHKDLWPLGLFAMLLGQFGLVELVTKVWSTFFITYESMWQTCQSLFSEKIWIGLKQLTRLPVDQLIWLAWLIILLIGIGFGLLFVAAVSQGALVYAGAKFSKFRLSYPDEVKSWHVGVRHVWRIIGLNILRKIVLSLSIMWAAFASYQLVIAPNGLGYFAFWVTFISALLIGLITSILLMYAVGYVVVEEYGLKKSIKAAWHLFLDHPIVSLEVAVMTFFLNIGFLLFALFSVLYVFFLPNIVARYFVLLFQAPPIGKIVGVGSYGLFLVVMMAASALFTVFVITVWSFLFSKMHSGNFASRLIRSIRR